MSSYTPLIEPPADDEQPVDGLARCGLDDPAKGLPSPHWPKKRDVLGVGVTPTNYAEAVELILAAGRRREGGIVACQAVHAIVTASRDEKLREAVNRFDLVTPDGQPVRWALNLLYRAGLSERVYGPELMRRLCAAAGEAGVSIFLYGGTDEVCRALVENLCRDYPDLVIAGWYAPPFRPLTEEEDALVVERANSSGAGLMFIGLGCPKQDWFAADHRERIKAVQLCVGAAFDFHAGVKAMAPSWMQRRGLEWVFRLYQEPRRLWKRYLETNSYFVMKLAAQYLGPRQERENGPHAPRAAMKSN